MATKSRVKSPLNNFLNAKLMSGGVLVGGGEVSLFVQSVTSNSSITSGVTLVYTVTLKAAASGSLTLLYGTTGTAVSGTNYSTTPTFSNGVTRLNNVLSIPNGVTSFTITYTTTDVGYYPTPKTLYVLVDFIKSNTLLNSSAEAWTQIPEATGITIPTDFVGMHHHAAYASETNIATLPYKAFRTHDSGAYPNSLFWYAIETSPGTYNWTNIDLEVNASFARGDTFMFCLWGTPKFNIIPTPNQEWQQNHAYSISTTADTFVIDQTVGASSKQCRYKCAKAGTSANTSSPTSSWVNRSNGIRAGAAGNTMTWSAGTVTVDAKINHGFSTGDWVKTYSYVTSAWTALAQITSTGLQTYTYPLAADPGTSPRTNELTMETGIVDGTVVWLPADHEAYTIPGDASPADPAKVNSFIAALMARYNTGGVRKISVLEIWNEPGFDHDGTMFFRGTASQMVDMVWAARLASKAADGATNNIPVIGCGFTYAAGAANNNPVYMTAFLNAIGDIYNTKKGVDTLVDGMSYHLYQAHIANGDQLNGVNMNGTGYNRNFRTIFTAAGGSGSTVPLYLSEFGLFLKDNASFSLSSLGKFLALSEDDRRIVLLQRLLFFACTGTKQMYLYAYHDAVLEYEFCGSLSTDTNGVRQALVDFNTLFAGKTITSAYFSNGYKLKVTISGVDYIYDSLTAGAPTV